MKVILNETLKKKGLSMLWLSKATDIRYPTIYNLCNNNTNRISFELLDKICTALDCSVSDILQEEKSK